jgi:hypothetical protein
MKQLIIFPIITISIYRFFFSLKVFTPNSIETFSPKEVNYHFEDVDAMSVSMMCLSMEIKIPFDKSLIEVRHIYLTAILIFG